MSPLRRSTSPQSDGRRFFFLPHRRSAEQSLASRTFAGAPGLARKWTWDRQGVSRPDRPDNHSDSRRGRCEHDEISRSDSAQTNEKTGARQLSVILLYRRRTSSCHHRDYCISLWQKKGDSGRLDVHWSWREQRADRLTKTLARLLSCLPKR